MYHKYLWFPNRLFIQTGSMINDDMTRSLAELVRLHKTGLKISIARFLINISHKIRKHGNCLITAVCETDNAYPASAHETELKERTVINVEQIGTAPENNDIDIRHADAKAQLTAYFLFFFFQILRHKERMIKPHRHIPQNT